MAPALSLNAAPGCPSGLAPPSLDPPRADPAAFVRSRDGDLDALDLMVQGAKCAACIQKIERTLLAQPGVREARLNLSTGRLSIAWTRGRQSPKALVEAVSNLGYGVAAFDPEANKQAIDREGRMLLRALAVAGFASMNIMMFSVPIWSGQNEMGDATRTLLHWVSAVIAIPASLYAGQPFFRSAWAALRKGRANMDVPISLGVILALTLSLYETAIQGPHAYFDSACMLLFLLLIGRTLDHRLREQARTAARDLLALQSTTAARIGADGAIASVAPRDLTVGDRIVIAVGDRAPVDCVIEDGPAEFDQSMLTGETAPLLAKAGDTVPAGAVNLTRPLHARVAAREDDSTVAALARLIELGEQGRAKFVRIADRAARLYVPVVHSLAAATLIGWLFGPGLLRSIGFAIADIGLHGAILHAVAVLIITCPCALGLAVPAVHIVATGRLFRRGVLVKSSDALERLAEIDTVVIDKTGTLTLGRPRLVGPVDAAALAQAASLARVSRHPLARALVEAAGAGQAVRGAEEIAGDGVRANIEGADVRLGRRRFAAPDAPENDDGAPELWLRVGDGAPTRFRFEDVLRSDAPAFIAGLKTRGIGVELVSGDRNQAVRSAAMAAGIHAWRASVTPAEKTARLVALKAQGRRTLMIGDGLNDAAALANAHASAAPGAAVDVSQAAADIVFQGEPLAPLLAAIDEARAARARVLQNLWFSALYNFIAAPVAIAGLVTPLIAALAMSGSSLIVTLNAMRPAGRR